MFSYAKCLLRHTKDGTSQSKDDNRERCIRSFDGVTSAAGLDARTGEGVRPEWSRIRSQAPMRGMYRAGATDDATWSARANSEVIGRSTVERDAEHLAL